MTSKERVYRALRKEYVDRVPLFMWLHPETVRVMQDYLGVPALSLDWVLFNDIRQTWVNNNYAMEGIIHNHDGDTHTDVWGIEWEKQYHFNQIKKSPLARADSDQVLEYRFPYEKAEKLMLPMQQIADAAEGFFLGCDVSPCAFEMYWRLRGMEDALLDFVRDPGLAGEMLHRCVDFALFLAEQAGQRFSLDWIWTGDDVASQTGMIISPDMWRKFIKPELKRLFDFAKSRGLYTAFHCCGALRPIIPDLIEIGMDVLNPIQAGCPGMDPKELKREFGNDISFMGGLDTQHLLPSGTPEEVYEATGGLIETMTADGGGFILAASHTIPPETPMDNIFALYKAAGITREAIFDRVSALEHPDG